MLTHRRYGKRSGDCRGKLSDLLHQIGGIVVIPIILLVFGQIAGVLYFDAAVVLVVGLAL
ncbi:MAG: hypothetical protein ACOCX3_00465 [Chloroflexota bacterium]